MLQPKISLSATPGNGNLITLNDATGLYSAINPGGYGDPNTGRTELSVGLLVDRRTFDKRYPEIVVNYPPETTEKTANSWQVLLTEDALYDYLYIAALDHNPALSHEANHVVFNPATKRFYKATRSVPATFAITDKRYWQELISVADYPLHLTSSTTRAYATLYQKIHRYESDLKFARLGTNFAKGHCHCEGVPDSAYKYATVLMYLRSVALNEGFKDYVAAGEQLDHAKELLDKLNDCEC